MAEGTSGGGIKGFLNGQTAGIPNWGWILVIGAGLAAAVLLPKFFGNKNASTTDTTGAGTDQTSGIGLAIDPTTGLPYAVEGLVPSGGTAGGGTGGGGGGTVTGPSNPVSPPPSTSGLIPLSGDTDNDQFFDPSTGKIVTIPGGGSTSTTAGTTTTGSGGGSSTTGTKSSTGGTTTQSSSQNTGTTTKTSTPAPAQPKVTTPQKPATPAQKFVTVQSWPNKLSTLSGIASANGISLAKIESLNPGIKDPNVIQAGQKIRVA